MIRADGPGPGGTIPPSVSTEGSQRQSVAAAALAVAGVLWSFFGLLDSWRPPVLWVGPLLAALGCLLPPRAALPWRSFLAVLSACYALTALVRPEFRADSGAYFAYLRSLAFDGDLDFSNEWEEWGQALPPPTATGLPGNQQSVGPALVWSPFFLLAHLWVRLSGHAVANGFSTPYIRAAAAGTLAVALAGSWLLAKTLAARFGRGTAALAVFTAVVASPVVYYLFVVPAMAHGLAYGVGALAVWAFARLESRGSRGGWALLGFLVGLITLIRWQAVVYALLAVPLALSAWRRRQLHPGWLALSGLCAVLVMVPQLVAWKVLYGSFLTIPQGSGFLSLWPQRSWDVLVHADHGLFSWTPVLLLAALGLVLGLAEWPRLAAAGLGIFAATVIVNGSVLHWAGDDAYGARRFDLVIPFFAYGLAVATRWLRRRPLAACVLLLLPFAAWNVGFIALVRSGAVRDPAGPGRLAEGQAVLAGRLAQQVLGGLLGDRGRAFAYKLFVGEYLYYNLNLDGTIRVTDPRERLLVSGWSAPRRNADPVFRWGYFPRSCVELPLEEPFDLRLALTARAPRRLAPHEVTVTLNEVPLQRITLDDTWREHALVLPTSGLRPGVNLWCLHYEKHLPGDDGGEVSAAVSRIQLP
jgi:hypothetical protein